MIQVEYLNDGTLVRHCSDAGFLLLQNETGSKYSDPVDLAPCRYTYSETDEKIESDDMVESDEATIEDYQNALTEFGVEV